MFRGLFGGNSEQRDVGANFAGSQSVAWRVGISESRISMQSGETVEMVQEKVKVGRGMLEIGHPFSAVETVGGGERLQRKSFGGRFW